MFAKTDKYAKEILLGNRLYENEKFAKALKHYINALRLKRDDYVANLNCANANFALKKYSKSIYYLDKIKLNYKDDAKIILLLARSCFELEKYEEASEYFEKLIVSGNKNPWNYNYLSQCYQKIGKYEKAFETGFEAIKLSGKNSLAHQLNFGYMLYEVKLEDKYDNVLNWCKKWLSEYPENKVTQYMGNALLGNGLDTADSLVGIKCIFDAFAPEFEKTLSDLEYKTPKVIADILQTRLLKKAEILDLGCGTGLCGKYLHKFAKLGGLYGVDISGKMLDEARKKHIYSKLFCTDIDSFLHKTQNCFDLVVASDVLTYFSKLDDVIDEVFNVLNQNGFFVFSVSKSPDDSDIYLHSSGRYAHSLKYVNSLAEKSGFTMDYFEESELRIENNKPVLGYVCLLAKN